MNTLVIDTQYWENYSDDLDKPYWKAKGGSTYVMYLDDSEAYQIEEGGIGFLENALTHEGKGSRERIISVRFAKEGEKLAEPWEKIYELTYNHRPQTLTMRSHQERDEYCSHWNPCIKSITKEWTLDMDGNNLPDTYKEIVERY